MKKQISQENTSEFLKACETCFCLKHLIIREKKTKKAEKWILEQKNFV